MALIVGNHVTPHRVSAAYTHGFQAQPLRIGVVDANAGGDTWDIVWDDGRRQAAVDEDSLDVLAVPVAFDLVGKVVELDINPDATLQPSSSYDATVLARFRRNLAGDGVYTVDRIYGKLLNADVYYETDATNASVLDNR
jgi:hypothetical protein